METSTAEEAALSSRSEPLATAAPRLTAPLPSPPPAANAIPERPRRTTPPPRSDATTPPPVEMLIPANPSPAPHTHFPVATRALERDRSSCGVGETAAAWRPRRAPSGKSVLTADPPSRRGGGAAARPSDGESRCRRAAADRPCSAREGKDVCHQSSGTLPRLAERLVRCCKLCSANAGNCRPLPQPRPRSPSVPVRLSRPSPQ
ncbi:uncharacterized protein LOC142599575 [Balearica regulorum gibbericeps]|uniref:uncharacterized protein LOC142599575 n=1 Tax=Balearica regulorum gibbericeps TaxID=100784 RepID=UPI003F627FB1